jgi:anaerobic selenocysteine-containing dehydrogenase
LAESEGVTGYDESDPPWKLFSKGHAIATDYKSLDDLWDKLESDGFWYRPSHGFYKWLDCFKTPSGKFEFFSSLLETFVKRAAGGEINAGAIKKIGMAATAEEAFMPHFEPVTASKEEDGLLLAPYELFNLSTGWLPSPPYLTKTLFDTQLRKNESFAEINPETAGKYDLAEGDPVILQSKQGEVRARIHIFEGAMPGIVYLPRGLGHSAAGIYLKDKGANPADIITGDNDPISGQKIWWNTRVTVRKA